LTGSTFIVMVALELRERFATSWTTIWKLYCYELSIWWKVSCEGHNMNHQGSLQDTAIKYVSMLFSEKKITSKNFNFRECNFRCCQGLYTKTREHIMLGRS